jgi:penicillin-binding protein 1A
MGRGKPAKVIKNYGKEYKGEIPLIQALSESRNAATVWVAREVIKRNKGGVAKLFEPAHLVGIESKIEPYITTALGATDVTQLELANAYRTLASGLRAEPYVVSKVVWTSGCTTRTFQPSVYMPPISFSTMNLILAGLRSVVRLPNGTAHDLDASDFPIQVAGKTGTTTAFKDSLFAGFTYGPDGITVVVRIGFDNPGIGYDENGNFGRGPGRGLGDREAGSRTALPIFKEIMLNTYNNGLVGPPPQFPKEIEEAVTAWREVLTVKTDK